MKSKPAFHILILVLLACLSACNPTEPIAEPIAEPTLHYPDSRPYTRWWWFAQRIHKADIRSQLDWLKAKGFGGVEIAWIYPPWRYDKSVVQDTSAPKWLSSEWSEAVQFTQTYADSLGLGVDFTFGSAWPTASSEIPPKLGAKIYGQPDWQQRVSFSWEFPENPLVIDHLNRDAFRAFAQPINQAMQPLLTKGKTALFTDSWEIKLNFRQKPWTDDFGDLFHEQFGYKIEPYMENLDQHPNQRFDYMKLLHDQVIEGFYKPFAKNARSLGSFSRIQCLASPTNVLTTYGLADVPESEALLNEPAYSRIPASAASLTGKREVSAEAFTCMYGFPGTYLREENAADIKLLGDALIAQGINQIIYHGMPYQAKEDTANFFATTYIGPGSNLSTDLPELNAYFSKVCSIMKKGRVWSDVAMYFPWEDKIMQGALPAEKRRVWVWGEYEMRNLGVPQQLKGYNPLWINGDFLKKSEYNDQKLQLGDTRFSMLYIEAKYMEMTALIEVLRLAKQGLPIILKNDLQQPGMNQDPRFPKLLTELKALKNVNQKLESWKISPLISFKEKNTLELIQYYPWVKETQNRLLVFIPHPFASEVKYPMQLGQSHTEETIRSQAKINYLGNQVELELIFKPYQSLLYSISKQGELSALDIKYVPTSPTIKAKEPQLRYF